MTVGVASTGATAQAVGPVAARLPTLIAGGAQTEGDHHPEIATSKSSCHAGCHRASASSASRQHLTVPTGDTPVSQAPVTYTMAHAWEMFAKWSCFVLVTNWDPRDDDKVPNAMLFEHQNVYVQVHSMLFSNPFKRNHWRHFSQAWVPREFASRCSVFLWIIKIL